MKLIVMTAALAAAEGLDAHSLLARMAAKKFWTLSVWQDDAALGAFIRYPPHVRLMTSLAPQMGQTKFVRWAIKGSAVPLVWDDALRRMQEQVELLPNSIPFIHKFVAQLS